MQQISVPRKHRAPWLFSPRVQRRKLGVPISRAHEKCKDVVSAASVLVDTQSTLIRELPVLFAK
jgi:hypothetical protein